MMFKREPLVKAADCQSLFLIKIKQSIYVKNKITTGRALLTPSIK